MAIAHEAAILFWHGVAFLIALLGLGIGILFLKNSFRQTRLHLAINPRIYSLILRGLGVGLILLFGWGIVNLANSP